MGVIGRAVGDFSGVLDLEAVLETSTAVRHPPPVQAVLKGFAAVHPFHCASPEASTLQ